MTEKFIVDAKGDDVTHRYTIDGDVKVFRPTVLHHIRSWVRYHIILRNAPTCTSLPEGIDMAWRQRGKPVRVWNSTNRWYGSVVTIYPPKDVKE